MLLHCGIAALRHCGPQPSRPVGTGRAGLDLSDDAPHGITLARSTDVKKEGSRLARLADFHRRHATEALAKLQQVAIDNGNVFAALVDTVRVCSLGQITNALFDVDGQYRRSM